MNKMKIEYFTVEDYQKTLTKEEKEAVDKTMKIISKAYNKYFEKQITECYVSPIYDPKEYIDCRTIKATGCA